MPSRAALQDRKIERLQPEPSVMGGDPYFISELTVDRL